LANKRGGGAVQFLQMVLGYRAQGFFGWNSRRGECSWRGNLGLGRRAFLVHGLLVGCILEGIL